MLTLFTSSAHSWRESIHAFNLLNLKHATDAGLIAKGELMLLFTFGYGSNWACMVVQH